MSYPKITPELRKFLDSEYGKKRIGEAMLYGTDKFLFGGKIYSTRQLHQLSQVVHEPILA